MKNSIVGGGTLSQSTTYNPTTTVTAGANGAVAGATVGNNKYVSLGKGGYSGDVSMTNSMAGQGILQANLNTGAGSVQQNAVALTSTVGGNGGGLSGFSPTITGPLK